MVFRIIMAGFLLISGMLFAGGTVAVNADAVYEKAESRVFQGRSEETVRSFYTNGTGVAAFQNALVDYRLGNMTTNVDCMRKSLQTLSNALLTGTNVFLITYYGLAYSSLAMLTPNFFEKLPSLSESFRLLDLAVELYPKHYLPRLYRSMMKLMAPSIVGGNEETGLKDMAFVLSNMGGIRRDNDYKSFIHFFYAMYWGDMKKDYAKAGEFLSNAGRLAQSQEMRSNIVRFQKKYEEKRGKAS